MVVCHVASGVRPALSIWIERFFYREVEHGFPILKLTGDESLTRALRELYCSDAEGFSELVRSLVAELDPSFYQRRMAGANDVVHRDAAILEFVDARDRLWDASIRAGRFGRMGPYFRAWKGRELQSVVLPLAEAHFGRRPERRHRGGGFEWTLVRDDYRAEVVLWLDGSISYEHAIINDNGARLIEGGGLLELLGLGPHRWHLPTRDEASARVAMSEALQMIEFFLGERPWVDRSEPASSRLDVQYTLASEHNAQPSWEPTLEHHPAQMRQEPTYSVAWIALGGSHADAAEIAAELFEAWAPAIAPSPEQLFRILESGRLPAKGRIGDLPATALPRDQRWLRLRARITGSAFLSLGLGGGNRVDCADILSFLTAFDGMSYWGSDGMCWATSRIPLPDPSSVAPHVGLFFRRKGRSSTEVTMLEQRMEELVARAFERGAIQALMARWAWLPQISMVVTPYEMLRGVSPHGALWRAWCSKFLHAAAERLWLGPPLVRRLGWGVERAYVRRNVGRAVRLDARESVTSDDLERALGRLLPADEDIAALREEARAALGRMFGAVSVPRSAREG
jgi:hypothetical protein